jgi:hypothetical protein
MTLNCSNEVDVTVYKLSKIINSLNSGFIFHLRFLLNFSLGAVSGKDNFRWLANKWKCYLPMKEIQVLVFVEFSGISSHLSF